MRRAAFPIAVLLLAVLAAAVALARVGGAEPGAQTAAVAASGDFASLANSGEGTPIFAASAIGPGDSARGTVEIADTGSVPVELTLSRRDLLDSPGLGGGLLSEALALTVADVTDPTAPLPIYAGPLASMPDQPAGRVEPGGSRSYEFVATLPAAGRPATRTSSRPRASRSPTPGPRPKRLRGRRRPRRSRDTRKRRPAARRRRRPPPPNRARRWSSR